MRFAIPALVLAGTLTGCSGLTDLSGKPSLPPGVQDPSTFRTPAGALQMYWATRAQFQVAFARALDATGVLTDELEAAGTSLDRRDLPEGVDAGDADAAYDALQAVRTYATQAVGALAAYAPAAPPALRGEAYALAGYAELLLADFYCSGVPLSRLEFEGDYVYQPGSTTRHVYAHAVALFDSALALSADSARIMNLARVGKGRALVALSRDSLTAAALVVAPVSDGYQYQFPIYWQGALGCVGEATVLSPAISEGVAQTISCLAAGASVSDVEGGMGVAYRSSGDPRSAAYAIPAWQGSTHYFPTKYGAPATATPVIVASGVEARLIEAEAALQAQPPQVETWLATLNALRTDGTYTTAVRYDPVTGDSVGVDTTWNAGTGGVAGLAPLGDPGTAAGRVKMLFTERAEWLFLTGHRQGDLRRLVRRVDQGGYGLPQGTVYPSGIYIGVGGEMSSGPTRTYGTDVTAPVPHRERANRLFTGCIDRGA